MSRSGVFFTADTHFAHVNVLRLSRRPFEDIVEMREMFVTNWNAVVQPEDTVYHLGDVHWSRSPKEISNLMRRFNGRKVLICGNHDTPDHLRDSFDEIHECRLRIDVDGQTIILDHYPLVEWHGFWHGTWHLHGHVHGSMPDCPHVFRLLDLPAIYKVPENQ